MVEEHVVGRSVAPRAGWPAGAGGQGRGGGVGRRGSEQAAERVAVERIAVLEIGVHDGVAAMAAEAFEAGGMHAEIHAGGERAALEAVAAEGGRVEAGGGGAGLHDAGDGARIDRRGADGGRPWHPAARGRGPDAAEQRAVGDPGGVLPAAQRAHRAECGGAERQGDGDAGAGAVALGERQGEAQPRGAASRCPTRIAASSDRRSAPANPVSSRARSRRPRRSSPIGARISRSTPTAAASFCAVTPRCGVTADTGERLADHRLGGRHRAAGEIMQIPDRGAAQIDGADRQAALALGGEERHDVGGGRGQAGQRVAGAPGAPGGDTPARVARRVLAALASRAKALAVARAVARVPSNAGSWVATARSNQRRTWIGGAPSGGGIASGAGRGAGGAFARVAGVVGPVGALSGAVMLALPGGCWPRQGARYCHARQGDLSGIARAGRGAGHITRPLHRIARFA